MARKKYIIWDEISDVYTPSGEKFTAEMWLERYPIAKLETEFLVISGGSYNGAYCVVFADMLDHYEKMGCDFSACDENDKQTYLDAIEAFEDARNEAMAHVVTDETRTADALEDLVLLQELQSEPMAATMSLLRSGEHSPQFAHLKERYDNGRISVNMLSKYVIGARITAEEFTEITGIEA